MYKLTFLCFFLIFTVTAQTKEICFTFDDLPMVAYSHNSLEFQEAKTQKLLKALSRHQVPAIGFYNEGKLYLNDTLSQRKLDMLLSWVDNGIELGNHTFSHPSYDEVSFAVYSEDILKNELITKKLLEDRGNELRYFRHPYLRIGDTKIKHDSLTLFLKLHGYTEAPVSIDNEEYLFALAYDRAMARKDSALMQEVGDLYITYMEEKLHFFEEQSEKLFDRNIKHILLMHANALNADFMDPLIEMHQKNGYSFITLDGALTDAAYLTEITKYGKWGISWLDRWALSQGKTGDFFQNDPKTPELILELTK